MAPLWCFHCLFSLLCSTYSFELQLFTPVFILFLDSASQIQSLCFIHLGHSGCLAVVRHLMEVYVSIMRFPLTPSTKLTRHGEDLKTSSLTDSQTFWACRMSSVLHDKRKEYEESFGAYSPGGCRKWPIGIRETKKDWKGSAAYTVAEQWDTHSAVR